MNYKDRLFWWVVLWLLLASFTAYLWRQNYYLYESNEQSILNINSKQADIIESQNDTIKYLKFKLTTLKSINHE